MASRDVDIDIDIRADLAILQRLNTQINSIISNIQRMGTMANSNFNSMITSANRYKQALHGIHSAQSSINSLPPPTPLVAPAAAAATPTPATGATPPVNNQMNQLAQGASALAIGAGFQKAGNMIVGAFQKATVAGMGFEQQMDKVAVLAGATNKQSKALSDTAVKLGAETTKSASEVAIAMTELGAKGFDTNKIIGAMPGIIAAAEASGEDLALTSDVVTSALNAFQMEGKDASRVADVLSMAANKTAAGVGDMGYAFKYAAPIFKVAGLSMEELAAATGLLKDKGLEGSQIGTSLRMGMLRLSAEPKAAKKEMDKLGFSATDANGKFKSLDKMTRELADSMQGMTAKEKLESVKNIFGVEAATGWMSLIEEAPGKLKSLTKELENSSGTAEKSSKKMMDNVAGGLETFRGNIESFQISIFKAFEGPVKTALFTFAKGIDKITDGFNKLSPTAKTALLTFTITVGVLAAIAGAALIAWGGFMLLTAGLGITTGALWALIWPIAAVIAAVALIAAGFVYMWQKFDWFRNGVTAGWVAIKTAAITAWSGIKATVMPAIAAIVAFAQIQIAKIKIFFQENGTQIMAIASALWAGVSGVFRIQFAIMLGIVKFAWGAIKAVTLLVWTGIKIAVSSGIDLITGVITAAMQILQGDWSGAWETIKNTAKTMITNVITILQNANLMDVGKKMIQSLIDGFSSMVGAVVDAATNIWNKIKGVFSGKSVSVPVNVNGTVPSGAKPNRASNGPTPSHATGLERVPKNGYFAQLHKNESVLTASQSNTLRSSGMLTASASGKPVLNMDSASSEYTPSSSGSNSSRGGNVSIVFSPSINVDASGTDAEGVGKVIEQKMREYHDYLISVYTPEGAY